MTYDAPRAAMLARERLMILHNSRARSFAMQWESCRRARTAPVPPPELQKWSTRVGTGD